jgi:acetylornithine/N-succinyldiaminopimelate aminotransferase
VPHASTFGGNALACAAALATLEVMDEEKLVERAKRLGEHLSASLRAVAARHPDRFSGERGLGLLRALVTTSGCSPVKIVAAAVKHGLLVSVAGSDGVRFSPPLTIGEAELDEAVRLVEAAALDVEIEK